MENRDLEVLEIQVKDFLDRCSEIKEKLLSLPDRKESSEGSKTVRLEPSD